MHARKALCLCFEGKRYYPRQATKESIARVTEAQARTNNARAYPLTAKSIETVRIWLVSFAQLSIPSPLPSWLTRENGPGPTFLRVQRVHTHTHTHTRLSSVTRTHATRSSFARALSHRVSCNHRSFVHRVSMNQC